MDEKIERVAKAICAERCAFMGEPACWQMKEDDRGNPLPWPAPGCNDPGCEALAMAACAALPVDDLANAARSYLDYCQTATKMQPLNMSVVRHKRAVLRDALTPFSSSGNRGD